MAFLICQLDQALSPQLFSKTLRTAVKRFWDVKSLWIKCKIILDNLAATAAAAAKSLQSCPTLWDPIDSSPPSSAIPGILQAGTTGVGCHFLLQCMKVKSESEVTESCPTLSDPWTVAFQAPPSMGFSRQEYWGGVPLPSPRWLLNCSIKKGRTLACLRK